MILFLGLKNPDREQSFDFLDNSLGTKLKSKSCAFDWKVVGNLVALHDL